jgi:hypothetical protein
VEKHESEFVVSISDSGSEISGRQYKKLKKLFQIVESYFTSGTRMRKAGTDRMQGIC